MIAPDDVPPLRGTAERYERLVELAPDGILTHDGMHITWANPAALRLAGAARISDLVGHPVATILHPPYLKAVQAQLIGTESPSELSAPMRDTIHRLDGVALDVEVRTVVFIEDGRPAAHLVIRDITDRLAAEQSARDVAAHLHQTQKMEVVGALAGGVAHEVNNMLQVILGFAALLLDHPELPASCVDDLREVKRAATQAALVTRQLLEFSRHAVHRPTAVSLEASVEAVIPTARRLLGETRQLRVVVDDAPLVWFDPGQLQQILVNLLLNARDATTVNGHIVLTVGVQQLIDPSIAADGVPILPGRYGVIRIRDDGVGIDAQIVSRIFEPFFTTKSSGAGTGLGLAAVHGLMTQNRGQVRVESVVGSGTTFTLYMPLSTRALSSADARAPTRLSHQPARVGAVVLVVDDEPAVRTVAARILERGGYVVQQAADGHQALAEIERSGVPSVVLTDLMMPGMSGRVLADALHARFPSLPVIFMSGYSSSALTGAGEVARHELLIEKPFTATSLLALVSTLVALQAH